MEHAIALDGLKPGGALSATPEQEGDPEVTDTINLVLER